MAVRPGVKIIVDRTKEVAEAIAALAGQRTLVGWPESTADERPMAGLNNPTLAYIHHNGAPENNLPARPALTIGIAKAQGKINDRMRKAGRAALDIKPAESLAQMQKMGQEASDAVRQAIADGIPPPLAESTLRGRIRQRKYGRKEASAELASRAAGNAPGVDIAKPLLMSGALMRAVNYVIRTAGKK